MKAYTYQIIILLIFTLQIIYTRDAPNRSDQNYTLHDECKNSDVDEGGPKEQRDCDNADRGFSCCFVTVDDGNYCMEVKKGNKTDLNELKAFVAKKSLYATITCSSEKLLLSAFMFLFLLLL